MWHKPCRTFHPWCLCIKTRCLCHDLLPIGGHTIIYTSDGLSWLNQLAKRDIKSVNNNTVGQRKKVTAVTFFPARPRPDQRCTNMGQNMKYEIAWFFVYRMDETRSQLSAHNGVLVLLVREIWQFKLFAGKGVTAVPATRREGGYWRRGRRLQYCGCWWPGDAIALSHLTRNILISTQETLIS